MALRIDTPEADHLAKYIGESVANAVIVALRERLERKKRRGQPTLAEELVRIGKECAALPALDNRTADEILGYDDNGLPA
ncbi:MAG: type II toxin-antitoxin system VapB family antitoxin [Caldilineaceae bacterium]